MSYYIIIALQVFCIYHLYKNRNNYYWVFLILFVPVLGCIIYLITQVYNKRDAEKVTNEIVTLINPTKKVKDLEKKLLFSETFQNHVNLADAYFEIGDYKNAIKHYKDALADNYKDDFYVVSKLIECNYALENFSEAISYSKIIESNSSFKRSKAQFVYGLSLEKLGELEEAEKQLRQIDQRYSNYEERLTLAKFLISRNKQEDAKEILHEINIESQHMTKPNKRKYRHVIIEVAKLLEH